MQPILLYDTTLRDGTQGENISFSADEKVKIAERLDDMGIHYIEGGWPGSNPKDIQFFDMARRIKFKQAKLAAFGATRKPGIAPEDDANLKALLETHSPVTTIFGKSWDLHVEKIMDNTLSENISMISESIEFLKSHQKEVIYDAEHFFDGYKENKAYAFQTITTAIQSGADFIVLCDTNGGTLSFEIENIIQEIFTQIEADSSLFSDNIKSKFGIHTHNDCGVAVANSITAIREGFSMVQGTINGYGERCGNADLTSIIPILCEKMDTCCIPREKLAQLYSLSSYVADTANLVPLNSRPFVGKSAFAHKGGIHVNAIMKTPRAYEHMPPELVGNT